jgi:hypothetical protein
VCSDIARSAAVIRQPILPHACETHRKVGADVKAFMRNVSDVKEESITDYLMWKWAEADPHFHYMKARSFSRFDESTMTGADFEMELWIVSDTGSLPLLFQAKKLTKPFAGYWQKLAYPRSTKQQLSMLFAYSQQVGRLPFYVFYADDDDSRGSGCSCGATCDSAVFMADARAIKSLVDATPRLRISKADLIDASSPFHCLFCCPLRNVGYMSLLVEFMQSVQSVARSPLPQYAKGLLDGTPPEKIEWRGEQELLQARLVGVYDMRLEAREPRKSDSPK